MKTLKVQFMTFVLFFTLMEVLFRLQSGTLTLNLLLLRSLVYALMTASFFLLMNCMSQSKLITGFTLLFGFFISVYVFIQIGMKGYYGAFFSFRFITQEVPQVGSYLNDFIAFLKPSYFLCFILYGLFAYMYLQTRQHQKLFKSLQAGLIGAIVPLLLFLSYITLLQIDTQAYIESSFNLYKNPYYTESAMNQLGLLAFIKTDFQYVVFPHRAVQKIEPPTVEPKPDKPPKVEIKDPLVRDIDDSQWLRVHEMEESTDFRAIDQYLLKQTIAPKNEMTGLFKDKNLVYFLVEAFDELAIHPQLTPTLYKMKMEGMYFNQFASPQFNCATAESELMSVASLFPVIGTCTYSNYYANTNPQTIYNLFKQQGYTVSSFHNWTDQFYPRSVIHPALGSGQYKDESETIPGRIGGWQSDLTMMETIVWDLNATQGPFMSYVITSSTHFPYDVESNLGNKYLNQVSKVMPEAPIDLQRYLSKSMELDHSVQYLIDNLNQMDDTVLVFFSDHRPFKVQGASLIKHADNTNKGGIYDSTPMMIYTPKGKPQVVSKVSSTIDLVPTLANLFDLNYDPRLFMGLDIFSKENNTVIMQSGSWRDQVGFYDAAKSLFTPFDANKTYTTEEVQARTNEVKQKLAISSSIYVNGYFKDRLFLGQTKLIYKKP